MEPNWGLKNCCNHEQVVFLITVAVCTVVILAVNTYHSLSVISYLLRLILGKVIVECFSFPLRDMTSWVMGLIWVELCLKVSRIL